MSAGVPAEAGVQRDGRAGPRPPPGRTGVRFAGYAAVFDRPDQGGDVVRAGAFARSLKRGVRTVPLLWEHDTAKPVGRIEYLREDRRGLRVIARLSGGAAGLEAAALLRQGKLAGLSFGYRVRRSKGEVPRELEDVELVEVSLVMRPMQPRARVHAVEGDAAE
jgi:HK97 family phage prohead protease